MAREHDTGDDASNPAQADRRDDPASGPDAEPAFDPAESLRLIREQQERAREATEPDTRLLCLAWGVAWLVGYLCLWASSVRTVEGDLGTFVFYTDASGDVVGAQPEAWAFWVFASLITAAVAFTIVHSVARTAGTRGVSARTGAMYGWSWMLGFTCYGIVLGGLARAGASVEVMALASNAGACLIVGLLYLGCGVAFDDRGLYALGVWILVVAAVATFVGLPLTYVVMALLGGGGFLAMALAAHVLLVRRRRLGLERPGPQGGEEAGRA